MMSIERSGVFTCTVPSTSSQCVVTSRSTRVEIGRAVARDQRARLARRSPPRRGRRRSRRARPARSSTAVCSAPHGIEAGADPAGERCRRASAAGSIERAVAAEELASGRRSSASAVRRDRRTRRASPNSAFQGLRANIAPVSGSISVTTNGRRRRARRAEHPLDVGRDRQPPRPRRTCCAASAARS